MESGIHGCGIRNPQRGIRNPRLSWITLHGATRGNQQAKRRTTFGSIEKYLTEKYVNAWQRNEWLAGLADRNKRKAKNTSGSTTGGGAASTAPAGSSTASSGTGAGGAGGAAMT